MRKRILALLLILALCASLAPAAHATEPEADRLCSLTLSYSRNGVGFGGLRIEIFRVAELTPAGEYRLLEPFSGYPIKIGGITSQEQWQDTAQTIRNFVEANAVEPTRAQMTDENGGVFFEGLETGLYMVMGTTAQNGTATVLFRDFMIYLPTPGEDGYEYDLTARPKSDEYQPPRRYTVVKLWDDDASRRPVSIVVDILKDGELYERVTLDSGNNWSYTWETGEEGAAWSVMERDVPEGYTVTIRQNETSFVITNTADPEEPDGPGPTPPPETGDTSPILLYMVLLCVSGLALVCLGFLWVRDGWNEKKR